jgi:mono/diheme cytochrome c family protein
VVAIFWALVALCLVACDRPPPAESLREWTPADHHSSDDDKLALAGQGQATGVGDSAQLVEVTWRQQCSTCHGLSGKGDGQMGPMVRAPDLTRDDWQSRVTDAEISAVIKNGKGKMPSFNVPDQVLDGLVARVRAARER